ncbi:MAG: murein biosynthesis integral membrane protein MurJ [Rhodospirillaceae bacterium]|jgi:putative peptidoglycan lipid II flippase|nr:murein biosynthesis integral membrane protein MurJ [Rhodospirillaceae bacterium]|tara:strand:- start:3478 stop:5031 length:1554 start_codon:yes stop_codon:yes gene_type:complete
MVLLRSIATVGGFTLISRVLGFLRDILIAAVLGAGAGADVFFVAFKLPNLFRRLFAEGAFSMAFVPMFAGRVEADGVKAAKAFAEAAFGVLFWTLLIFVTVIELAMPLVMLGFAPGFIGDAAKFDLAVELTRITFPYLLFVALVSLMAGVLNSLGRFAAAAATPILLNLCLIGAILGLANFTETPGHALAWGVAAAGGVQFIWLYAACVREGVWIRLGFPRLTGDVKILMKRMAPVAVGAGVYQINLVIDTVIASFLPSGSISYLFFADRVNQLPLGVIGVAVGTALLPLLSRQVRAGEEAAALHSQNRALEFSFLLTLPAAAALMVIAGPVVRVLFERGAFGPAETAATAAALAVYAVGLPAYVAVKVLAPGFFARQDTATPVKISVVCLLVNLGLNLILMGPFKHVGIAMATVVSSWLNAGLLAYVLHKRGHFALDRRLGRRLPRILLASAGMTAALALALALTPLGGALAGPVVERIGALVMLVVGGMAVFGALVWVTGAARPRDLKSLYRGAG